VKSRKLAAARFVLTDLFLVENLRLRESSMTQNISEPVLFLLSVNTLLLTIILPLRNHQKGDLSKIYTWKVYKKLKYC